MNKTKKKILIASLDLFNEFGLLNVSQRRITEFLKISPGNLTYHFKKKEDISEMLYFEFVDIIEAETKIYLKSERKMTDYAKLIENWFAYMYDYRFIFFDLTNLLRMNEKIATNYEQLIQIRASIFLKTVNSLIATKIIRQAEMPNEYEHLYSRLHIVSDFYLSYQRAAGKSIKKEVQTKHTAIFFHAIYPYLTQKGKEEFKAIF